MAKKKRSFVVVGLGRFGTRVAKELVAYGNSVLGIDTEERFVSPVADILTEAVIADARDEAALREAGVGSYDAAIVAIGSNLEASVLAHMNLQTLGIDQITVKAFDAQHARILEALGAEDIVIPEQDAGAHIAQRLHNPRIVDFMEVREGRYVALVEAPPRHVGRTMAAIAADKDIDLRFMGLLRGEAYLAPDGPDELFVAAADRLLIGGSRAAVRDFADAG